MYFNRYKCAKTKTVKCFTSTSESTKFNLGITHPADEERRGIWTLSSYLLFWLEISRKSYKHALSGLSMRCKASQRRGVLFCTAVWYWAATEFKVCFIATATYTDTLSRSLCPHPHLLPPTHCQSTSLGEEKFKAKFSLLLKQHIDEWISQIVLYGTNGNLVLLVK